jgi:single-strand DNA-binding protein
MAGINRVMLIGNVGRDAEVRYTQSGQAVASFSLATSEVYSDKTSGERQERVEWHNIVAWGRQAEIAGQYVKKGRQVYVEGRLQTRDWVDPQGVKHYKTEIVARNFQLLGRRDEGGARDEGGHAPAARGGGATPSQPYDEYDIGDLGPPLDMDDSPLSPGD